MSYGLLGTQPPVKHKVFVSFHHGGDQPYYDAFSTTFHDTYESIFDNSLERRVDSDDVNYVRRRIRESYIKGSSCTIVLVGAQTWGRKYVDWEIDATLEMGHALIGVRLPTAPVSEGKVIVPDRLHDNIVSGYALWENWARVTSNAVQLDAFVAAAKQKGQNLINNTRGRRLRNA
jgi:hypothetical protein